MAHVIITVIPKPANDHEHSLISVEPAKWNVPLNTTIAELFDCGNDSIRDFYRQNPAHRKVQFQVESILITSIYDQ